MATVPQDTGHGVTRTELIALAAFAAVGAGISLLQTFAPVL